MGWHTSDRPKHPRVQWSVTSSISLLNANPNKGDQKDGGLEQHYF
jgi:hypothetical protein